MLAPLCYPIAGHVPYWIIDRFGFLETCAASGSETFGLKLGKSTYLLNCHEDIKHVLETNYTNYTKNARLRDREGKRLFGEGVQTQSGDKHKQQRRRIQPVFMRKAIAAFSPQIVAVVDQQLARWESQAEIDIAKESLWLVHCVLGKVLFGLDFNQPVSQSAHQSDRAFGDAVLARRRQVNRQFSLRIPSAKMSITGRSTSYSQSMQLLELSVDQMIQDRRDRPTEYQDLLSVLVQIQSSRGNMGGKQMRDEALAISGGYETIAAVLIWTWYLLGQHLEVKDMLLQEVVQIIGDRTPTAEDIPSLKYTKRVMDESLRLYPPTWIFTRSAQQLDTLPSGSRLQPGAKLYLSSYLVHRNPAYFPEPEKFDPARFSKAEKAARPDFAYFPFGGGPRVCIGQTLAETVAMLILVTMAQRIQLTLIPHQTITKRTLTTLLPKQPLKMQVHRSGIAQ
ncbi:MAG: cytochrome P450 [Phormidesmis sp.]